jgi:hypothetical protein
MRSSFLKSFGLGKDCEHRLRFHVSLDYFTAALPKPPPPVLDTPEPPPPVLVSPFAVTEPDDLPPEGCGSLFLIHRSRRRPQDNVCRCFVWRVDFALISEFRDVCETRVYYLLLARLGGSIINF